MVPTRIIKNIRRTKHNREMTVVFNVFGGSANYSTKTSVGFIIHVLVELMRLGIANSLGVYFFSENLTRERSNAGAFSFLVYCLTTVLVLAGFQSDSIGEAFASGIVLSVIPSVSVHAAMCYVNPSWRQVYIIGDVVGAMVSYALTMAAQQSVAE